MDRCWVQMLTRIIVDLHKLLHSIWYRIIKFQCKRIAWSVFLPVAELEEINEWFAKWFGIYEIKRKYLHWVAQFISAFCTFLS